MISRLPVQIVEQKRRAREDKRLVQDRVDTVAVPSYTEADQSWGAPAAILRPADSRLGNKNRESKSLQPSRTGQGMRVSA